MTRARDLARIANSNALTIDSSGNVGIGSTVPTSKLSVVGIVSATTYFGNGANLSGISVNRFLTVTARVGIVSVTAFAGILTVFGRSSNTNIFV